jgi:ribosomal protein L7/L12
MNMTLTLTKTELVAALSKQFNLPSDIDLKVTISDGLPSKVLNDFIAIKDFIRQNQKIKAIKALRDASPQVTDFTYGGFRAEMGLSDAKQAVEDWENYVQACHNAGRMLIKWSRTN